MKVEKTNYLIRRAVESDFEQVFEIWLENQRTAIGTEGVIDNSKAKIHLKKLFDIEEPCFFFIVAEDEHNKILGWQSCLPFGNNPNYYNEQGESSTYVRKEYWNEGVGYKLFKAILEMLPMTSIKILFGKIISSNAVMIKIAKELGCVEIGMIQKSIKRNQTPRIMLLYYNVPEPVESNSCA
ncbi:MAG: GNAT family N-acetyltransferase [Saprospiraceae bacterium]|nr:GNAT family N-acetyltransferase [Saprospiraceae bacterium]